MPYKRPGEGVYVTNGGTAITHGAPAINNNFVGIAIKQKAPLPTDALSTHTTIAASEDYFLVTKGVVQVDVGAMTAPLGTAIYITSAGALSTTAAGNTKFGRVVEVAGKRGTPTGKIRVDLDTKDSV